MKILIIKIGALGDVVRTSFIAQALKNKYRGEEPEIFWVTNEKARSFFINNSYVNHVISDKNKKILKKINFDLAINLEEDIENAKFFSSMDCKRIIGVFLNKSGKIDYTEDSSHWFDMSVISKLGKEKADALKLKNKRTHRELMAQMIGVLSDKYEPFLRLNEYQRKISENFLRRHNLSKKELIIGINTGAADRWPKSLSVEKTADLIDKIHKKYKAKILLFGGPNEVERNQKIIQLSNSPIIDTGCGNDLIEFPALVGICSLFVTTDSLGLHISLALKRKTICLIGPTPPNEIEMYLIGKKIVSSSKCTGCLENDCRSMEKINIKEVLDSVEKLLSQRIALIITAYREQKLGKAIESAINQKTNNDYGIIVSAPDDETLGIAKKYLHQKNLKIFKDPGRGKSYALNKIIEEVDADILILTDGDVFISENSVEEIVSLFSDPEIGCVTGQPVPLEDKKTKYGYWANFLFSAANIIRKKAYVSNSFIECSGYLFAFRKNKIAKIPLDTAEDTVIPYYFWEKGYRIGYAENAKVYVKNVANWVEWISQKTRTSKAHENLYKYVDIQTTPRVKSFSNEIMGISLVMNYPKNLKEFFWTYQLIMARLYMWYRVFLDTRIKNRQFKDNWERVESAR